MSRGRIEGPGRKVATGHLRVDTARAVKKLREYQLAEPETWVLEVLRAAVTLGATRLYVEGDAGDVVVGWDGGLLDDETMRTVLDELVNPGAARLEGAIRRLATGLNTALGPVRVLGRHAQPPRHVDLERTDADGSRTRVRYTSELLDAEVTANDEPTAGESALASLRAERVPPAPPGAPPGMRVHLERRSLHTFVRFLGRAEPDELRVVRECADDVPVPLHIGGDVLHVADSSYDLVRVPLGQGLVGFVALVDADSIAAGNHPAWVDFAERGVILAREPLPLGDQWRDPRASVPIRVFLDRQTLPTNASRSAVRMDGALRSALDVASERVPTLLRELHRVLRGTLTEDADEPGDPDTARSDASALASEPNAPLSETPRRHHRLRKSALQLLAAHVRGRPWTYTSSGMPKELEPLLELPLLRDALGAARGVGHFGDVAGLVYRGTAPLDPNVYGEIPTRLPYIPRGDAAERLLAEDGHDEAAVRALLEAAAAAGRAKAAFMQTATMDASVPSSDRDAWLAIPLRAKRARSLARGRPVPNEDIEGELGLYATRGSARGRITLLHEGRPLDEILLPAPCSYRAVVACKRITPRADYRGAQEDDVRREVVAAVERALIVAAEQAALVERGQRPTVEGTRVLRAPESDDASVRERTRALLAVFAHAAEDPDAVSASPLGTAPLLTVLEPSGKQHQKSIAQVLTQAKNERALLYRPALQGSPPTHTVVILDQEWVVSLGALIGVPTARLDATTATTPSSTIPRVSDDVVLRVWSRDFVADIGWGQTSDSWTVFREGAVIDRGSVQGRIVPVSVRIDDARVIVDGRTREIVARPDAAGQLALLERELVLALVAAAKGDPPAELRALRAVDVPRQLCRAMALAPKPLRKLFGDEHQWLSDHLELPTSRGAHVPLATLRRREVIYWLPTGVRVPFEHPDFDPVALDQEWAQWLRTMLGRGLQDGLAVMSEFARQAGGKDQRRRVLAQPPLPPPRVAKDDAGALRVQHKDGEGTLWITSDARPRLRITVAERALIEIDTPDDLPLGGQLDVPERAVDAAWDALTPAAMASLTHVLRGQLSELLVQLAERQPLDLLSPRGERLVAAWANGRHEKSESRVRQALMHAVAWPSVQGERVSMLTAKRRSRIQCAVFEGTWLGQSKGERKTTYDHPVIAIVAPVESSQLARYAEWLDAGAVGDVTIGLQQLQARRRVEQGHSERPRLGHADAVSIAELCQDEARLRTGLGPGEVRLALGTEGNNPTSVRLHRGGRVVATQALPVFPPLQVALEGSGYLSPQRPDQMDPLQVNTLTQRVQALAALLVQRAFQAEPPPALRGAVRDAWLGRGKLDDKAVAALPVLQTTAGTWVTPGELAASTGRHGQWYTTDLTCTVIPEDTSRSALRLSDREGKALGQRVKVRDATEELALQPIRQANRARPKATTLDARQVLATLTPHSDALILAFREFETSDGRGSLVLLTPEGAAFEGLHVHRAMHPLGVHACPLPWPALVVVDDAGLTPNKRYDGPKEDARFRSLVELAANEGSAALTARFGPGQGFGERSVDQTLSTGTLVRGLVSLGGPSDGGALSIAATGRSVTEWPLRGELWLCLPRGARVRHGVRVDEVRTAARAAYERLLSDLGDALIGAAPDPGHAPFVARASSWSHAQRDQAVAHVIVGARAGCLHRKHPARTRLHLHAFTAPMTLADVLAVLDGHVPVFRAAPGDIYAIATEGPALRIDGSQTCAVLVRALGLRLRARPTPTPPHRTAPAPTLAELEDDTARTRTEGRGSVAAPATKPSKSPHHPIPRTVEALRSLLDVAHTPGKVVRVALAVSPHRRQPLVIYDHVKKVVALSGGAPELERLEQALRASDPRAPRATVALAAHVLAVVDEDVLRPKRIDHVALLETWCRLTTGM
ncbi:MAG: hypothetical protein H6726_12440 [Sandaracinaceae bacterium]|nr:hypothetical protein [Sandaracinaceae bacterium]